MANSQQQRRLKELEKKKAAEVSRTKVTRAEAWAALGHVYQPKWIREQYGVDDPISEAEEEYWQANRHKPRDEAVFMRVLLAKAAREPERFQRIYGDMFKADAADGTQE